MNEPTTRRAKREATAQRILEAAQAEFGEHGLERTTIRAIAKRAGVDPSLVIQHYGSKAELFALAIKLRADDSEGDVGDHLREVLNVRLEEPPLQTRALVRSMLTVPEAAEVMRRFLDERTVNLVGDSEDPDERLRAALAVTSILGFTIARHFLAVDALQDISPRQVDEIVHPWVVGALRDVG